MHFECFNIQRLRKDAGVLLLRVHVLYTNYPRLDCVANG